ncbi:MAG: hypothetical protein Q8L68_07880, partial [Methylococcales bacterium]|nr:hypothetical protein [Methylococcales bacterium]
FARHFATSKTLTMFVPFSMTVPFLTLSQNAEFVFELAFALYAKRLTVCVSGGGAGVDKTPRPRFCSGVDKARKCRRIPTVHCTLC